MKLPVRTWGCYIIDADNRCVALATLAMGNNFTEWTLDERLSHAKQIASALNRSSEITNAAIDPHMPDE